MLDYALLIILSKSIQWNVMRDRPLTRDHFCSKIALHLLHRVPTLPWKPGILSFTLPGLENVWNLLIKWEKPGILTQNLEKIEIWKFNVWRFTFQAVICNNKNAIQAVICNNKNSIYIFVISTLSTHTDSKPKWPGISLLLLGNNLGKYMEFCVTIEVWTLLPYIHLYLLWKTFYIRP